MAKAKAAASKKAAGKVSKSKKQDTPPDDPELHERIMSTGEASRLLNKAGLAIAYLVARDGMDEELAASIVEGMDSEALHELVTEALVAPDPHVGKAEPVGKPETGGQLVPIDSLTEEELDKGREYVDLFTVEGLMSDPEDIPTIIQDCIDAARAKNHNEAVYKAKKKRLVTKMDAAVAPNLLFGEVKLARYTGHTVTLSEQKLLEKGVDPDIIKACWADTPYEDVRITVPKGAK